MRKLTIAAFLGVTVSAVAAPDAQREQPSDVTFRGGIDSVRVDMYVSRDGTPVTDLRAEEVEVREDGALQKIDTFEHVAVPSGGPEATRIQPSSIRDSREMVGDPRARVFVIFLDTYHFEAQFSQQLQGPMRRFLQEALGPDDLVALMTPEMDVADLTFGRRTAVLSEFLNDTSEWMQREIPWVALDNTERLYRECYPSPADAANSIAARMIRRRRERFTLDALENLSIYLGAIRDERKTVLVPTMGWALFGPDDSLAGASPGGSIPVAPVDRIRGGRGAAGQDRTTSSQIIQCENDRQTLAFLDHRDRLREITGAANRANVSFYPMTPLRNPEGSNGAGSFGRLSELRGLAEETDGMAVVNTNDIAPAMQRIIEDSSSYYLLGYQPTKPADGSYRSIRVSVKRPGVEVRARKGYRAAPAVRAPEIDTRNAPGGPAPRRDDAVARAFNELARAQTPVPLRLRAASWAQPAATGATGRLWIAGELDAATRRDPDWQSGARAEIVIVGPKGGQITRTVDVPAGAPGFVVDLGADGARAGAGSYDLRVSVTSRAAGSAQLVEITNVDIPPDGSPLGDAVLLRGGPGQRPYVAAADPRFRRNERLRLELPTASASAADARVIDRAGQTTQVPAQVSERPDPGGAFRWIVVDVTLVPFAPAEYAVAVSQDGVTRITGFRVVQ